MKDVIVDGGDYIFLSRQELDILLDEARATCVEEEFPQPLSKGDLSPTECAFIVRLRENVKWYEKILVRQIRMDGMGVSVFRFHLRDIG